MFGRPYGGLHPIGARRSKGAGVRGIDSWVMLMVMQLLSQINQLPRKPPVTLFLMAVNVALWLAPGLVLPYGEEPMMCPSEIVQGYRPWTHLLLAAFIHAADGGYHLVYNMSSLLWKGVTLELEMGSEAFTAMVAALLVLSHGLFVPVSYIATFALGAPTYHSCAVGFSAVLFALKVVMNHSALGDRAVALWGIPFPVQAKYAAWVELVLISLVTPNASFVGHLCGILAGVIWLHVAGLARGRSRPRSSSWRPSPGPGRRPAQRPFWGGGRLGSAAAAAPAAAPGRAVFYDDADAIARALERSRREY